METLSAFANDISSFQINVPLWFKISIILVLIILLLVGGYFIKDIVDISYLKNGYNWYIIVALINLLSILCIFYYYGSNTDNITNNATYIGARGVKGVKGIKGKKGTSVSCSYNCKNNIYIQSVRKTDKICTLSVYNENFKSLLANYNYFSNFITKGNNIDNIDYGRFINNILIKNTDYTQKGTQLQSITATDKFRGLLSINAITILLINHINYEIATTSTDTYGTFNAPVPKVGYIALGHTVYGGTESIESNTISNPNAFNLNSFVVSGNIMYPAGYNKLVSFKSYNYNTQDYDNYTIWKPNIQSVNEPTFNGETAVLSYLSLGDICSYSNKQPKINDIALIKEDCLEAVNIKDLKLIFIYVGDNDGDGDGDSNGNGNINNTTKKNKVDYRQTDSYLITNKINNDIDIFSVWRTPMNTFITNCNTDNKLVNNTLMYNILNDMNDAVNEYGNINNEYKKWVQDKLRNISIPKFLTAIIYTQHLMLNSRKELIYYINKYQSQVPEFKDIAMSINTYELYDLLNIVKNTITIYKNFNKELVKNISISLRTDNPIVYNEKEERHLPTMLLKIYNNIIDKINTLPVQIENTHNFLDIVNYIIPNGLNGRIAIDSSGIVEGGFFLTEIQELIVRLCKIIFPPSRITYTIKDECLGTFARDNKREQIIQQFINEKDIYNKYIDKIKNDSETYKSQLQMIKTYEDIAILKLGQLVGHIPNYIENIHKADLDKFTTTRIYGIIMVYKDINAQLNTIAPNTDI